MFDVSAVLDRFPFAFHSMFSLVDDSVVVDDSLDADHDDVHDESHYWYDDYGVRCPLHDHHHLDGGRQHPYIVIPSWRMGTNQDISHGTYQVNLILVYNFAALHRSCYYYYFQYRIFEIRIPLVISI